MVLIIVISFGILFVLENTQVDDGGHYTAHEALVSSSTTTTTDTNNNNNPASLRANTSTQQQQQQEYHDFPSPLDVLSANDAILKIIPLYGSHRPDQDAVFGFASALRFDCLLRFVGTLVDSGYTGDIVVGVNKAHELDNTTRSFLQYHAAHSNLIAYPAELVCKKVKTRTRCKAYKMFLNSKIQGYLPDPRPYREIVQLRFDYYWAWSTLYSDQARLFLLDTKDLYFQGNPFHGLKPQMANELTAFQESPLKTVSDEYQPKIWQQEEKHDVRLVRRLGKKNILTLGAVVGGQPAIEAYTRAMVEDFDITECQHLECAQVSHNYLFWSGYLKKRSPQIEEVIMAEQGKSVVNTLYILSKYGGSSLKEVNVVNDQNQVVNTNGKPSAVVHQYEQDKHLNDVVEALTGEQQDKWRRIAETLAQTEG